MQDDGEEGEPRLYPVDAAKNYFPEGATKKKLTRGPKLR